MFGEVSFDALWARLLNRHHASQSYIPYGEEASLVSSPPPRPIMPFVDRRNSTCAYMLGNGREFAE